MASIQVGSFENGLISFYVNYNANNGRVQSIDCINNAPLPAYGEVTDPATGTVYSRTYQPAPGVTQSQAVPAGILTIRTSVDPDAGIPVLEVRNSSTGLWQILPTQFRYPA